MPEFLKNITDGAKFFIMLLIYTGYMTWWASGISHQLDAVTVHLEEHLIAGDHHPTNQTIAINNLNKSQEEIAQVLKENSIQHAKCTVIMDNILRRLERLEQFENAEHRWEKK